MICQVNELNIVEDTIGLDIYSLHQDISTADLIHAYQNIEINEEDLNKSYEIII